MPSQPTYSFNAQSPFQLSNDSAYALWRSNKLANYPKTRQQLIVSVNSATDVSPNEHALILQRLAKANMCIYQFKRFEGTSKSDIKYFASQFGYQHLDTNICADEDSISSLQTKEQGRHAAYIPYSANKLSWHTDGYYNQPQNTIRGMLLHCVNSAPIGGENQYLDPDILYIHLRDLNPDFIDALMDEKALTIPPNEAQGVERAAQTGAVYSLDNAANRLHLRYTARTRSILWDDNPILRQALEEITRYLQSDSAYIFRHKLEAGQGIVCNNVLHNRTAFEENDSETSKRLIYRARFYERADGS